MTHACEPASLIHTQTQEDTHAPTMTCYDSIFCLHLPPFPFSPLCSLSSPLLAPLLLPLIICRVADGGYDNYQKQTKQKANVKSSVSPSLECFCHLWRADRPFQGGEEKSQTWFLHKSSQTGFALCKHACTHADMQIKMRDIACKSSGGSSFAQSTKTNYRANVLMNSSIRNSLIKIHFCC